MIKYQRETFFFEKHTTNMGQSNRVYGFTRKHRHRHYSCHRHPAASNPAPGFQGQESQTRMQLDPENIPAMTRYFQHQMENMSSQRAQSYEANLLVFARQLSTLTGITVIFSMMTQLFLGLLRHLLDRTQE